MSLARRLKGLERAAAARWVEEAGRCGACGHPERSLGSVTTYNDEPFPAGTCAACGRGLTAEGRPAQDYRCHIVIEYDEASDRGARRG